MLLLREGIVKANIWDIGGGHGRTTSQKPRRKSIADILRAAYQLHTRDAWTRRAVKRVLR
jgi:hypothetical protein